MPSIHAILEIARTGSGPFQTGLSPFTVNKRVGKAKFGSVRREALAFREAGALRTQFLGSMLLHFGVENLIQRIRILKSSPNLFASFVAGYPSGALRRSRNVLNPSNSPPRICLAPSFRFFPNCPRFPSKTFSINSALPSASPSAK